MMGAMNLTDTHCHLQDPRLAGDLDAVLGRARAAGVARFVCCGTREADWNAVLALREAHEGVIPMLGLHPWFVGEAAPGWTDRLEALLAATGAGVGECGLDFALESFDRELQVVALRCHLRLARALDRPLTLHVRRAWEALIQVVREEGLPEAGAAIHAYSGSAETARELQSLGFHLGFGCGLARPDAHRARKAVRAVARDRLLLETDSPDLAPRHLPGDAEGRPNEPANLRIALQAAAEARQEALESLAAAAEASALALFGNIRAK